MKFFSFNKNHAATMATLMAVIFFGALYFFIYVPNNERRVQEQRFRTLQLIDRNIHANIENSIGMMNNLLGAYHKKGDSARKTVVKYVKSFPQQNFSITLPEKVNSTEKGVGTDTGFAIRVDNEKHEILLHVSKAFEDEDAGLYRMSMRYTFDQFSRSLLPENVFDQYVVFSNGQVAYETFPSGISYTKDSLLGRKNGIVSATVRNLSVGGVDYKVFLQPVTLTTDSVWVIGGLLTNKNYQLEKNQLPPNIILLLMTFAVIAIVAFPWVKLYQMGGKDRLTVWDGMRTIVVSMLLMSLLFFMFSKYNTVFRKSEDAKIGLSNQITRSFLQELDSARATLYRLDSNVAASKRAPKDSLIQTVTRPIKINQVFWLKENGEETANWIADSIHAPHGNFKDRPYYKAIVNHTMYQKGDDTAHKFFLGQVVSWNSGVFTSVMSIKSIVPGEKVAAVSFDMGSVSDPILPAGYQFAIIDDNGKVRYHSNAKRNLKENLLDEFSENARLRSGLAARATDSFRTQYYSSEYYVHIKPIPGLPYFMVVLEDVGYKATRDIQVYGFTFSLMLMLFLFLMLQLLIVFLVSAKNSFFKKQLYDTSWIGPKVSSHHEYNIAILFNLLVIVLAILFIRHSSFLTYLYILMFTITLLTMFLNDLFRRKYRAMHRIENKQFKSRSYYALLMFAALIDALAWKSLDPDNKITLAVYEAILVLVAIAVFKWGGALLNGIKKVGSPAVTKKWDYTRSFTLMAVTRLIITSGIPVAFFYISSFNYEQNISIRYRQLKYATTLLERRVSKQLPIISDTADFTRGYYYDGVWVKNVSLRNNVTPAGNTREEKFTSDMLRLFHVKLTEHAIAEDRFNANEAEDQSFFYNSLLRSACRKDSFTTTYVRTPVPGQFLTLSASPVNYKIPSPTFGHGVPGALFYVLLLAALVAFYFIIYNIINRIFCFKLPDLTLWKALDDRILSNPEVNRLLFIIGLPGSGKLSIIKDHIKNGKIKTKGDPLVFDPENPDDNNVFIADLINIPDSGDIGNDNTNWKRFMTQVSSDKNRLIIVNHFEYNIQDAATNRIKLNLLEELMLANKSQIIILSTIHPVAFLDSAMAAMTDDAKQHSIPGQDLERWHVLLGHYRIIVLPLEPLPMQNDDYSLRPVYAETQQTHFLRKLQECVVAVAKDIPEPERAKKGDELAFKLQVTSHYFYMYIWQSLTKEEKFLLYDLAEDNLVNSYDDYNLNMLLAKGVIIRPDGTLKLFNRGFRNFILTAIGNTEAMKIKNHIKDDGNWNKLKTPLIIVILAILTFLFASQQEAYSKLITYVAALAAGVPMVLKVFSLFDKSGQKGNG